MAAYGSNPDGGAIFFPFAYLLAVIISVICIAGLITGVTYN